MTRPVADPQPFDGKPPAPGGKPWLRFAIGAVFAIGIASFFALGGPEWLTLDRIKTNRDALLQFADTHFAAALAIAFVLYAGAVALSIPGAVVLTLAAGYVFGRWIGFALVVTAATVGATIVFVAARYLFADAARRRMGALGEKINAGFTADAFSYLLFLRLTPVFPFFLVNLAPALTTVPTRTYVVATLVGIAPATFVFVNLGQALARIESVHGLVSPTTLSALALLGLLALAPVALRKWQSRPARNT